MIITSGSSAIFLWLLEFALPDAATRLPGLTLLPMIAAIADRPTVQHHFGVKFSTRYRADPQQSPVAVTISNDASHCLPTNQRPEMPGSLLATSVGTLGALTNLTPFRRINPGQPHLTIIQQNRVAIESNGAALKYLFRSRDQPPQADHQNQHYANLQKLTFNPTRRNSCSASTSHEFGNPKISLPRHERISDRKFRTQTPVICCQSDGFINQTFLLPPHTVRHGRSIGLSHP